MSTPAYAGNVKLSWTAPEGPLNFEKYRIYWGEKTGEYIDHKDVRNNETFTTVWKLDDKKTYYFVATTVAASGQESVYSNEVNTYLDVDSDNDGILDQQEIKKYGTDPNQADTDGDGINDGDELAFWQDAWDQDADGDGKINLLDHDADDDGLADGVEINDGTDPQVREVKPEPELELALLTVMSVQASDAQAPNVPAHTLDGALQTRWSSEGDGQWIAYDIGSVSTVSEVAIAWFRGDRRRASFSIEVSLDGTNWKEVLSEDSSGATKDFESYPIPAVAARYVRIVGYGNSDNMWNSITEVELYGFVH